MFTFLQVFVTVSQRDMHQERDHPCNNSSSQSPKSLESHSVIEKSQSLHSATLPTTTHSSTIKTTISVNLPSSSTSSQTSVVATGGNQAMSSNPRIIVVKSPNSKTGLMTTILKKVEVIQPQKCANCQEFVMANGGHVCEVPWKCPFCLEKCYKSLVGLRKHVREAHGGQGQQQLEVCETCQIAFKIDGNGKSGLEIHNKEKHSGSGSSIPSSPESFHGFVTPTKEFEMASRNNYETVILNLNDIY